MTIPWLRLTSLFRRCGRGRWRPSAADRLVLDGRQVIVAHERSLYTGPETLVVARYREVLDRKAGVFAGSTPPCAGRHCGELAL
jgi:hypothetical protein